MPLVDLVFRRVENLVDLLGIGRSGGGTVTTTSVEMGV